MKSIVIITNHYPFGLQESFLEREVEIWGMKNINVTIMPLNKSSTKRNVPDNIDIDLSLVNLGKLNALKSRIAFNISGMVIKECIEHKGNIDPKSLIWTAIIVSSIYKILKDRKIETLYTYWNDVAFYAGALLKKTGKIENLFSRVHGFDLYKERRRNNHMPFKRQLCNYADKIHVISDVQIDYYINNYNVELNKIKTSRLGVCVDEGNVKLNESSELKVLSIAYCVPVKQLEKIIDAVFLLSSKNDFQVHYTHLGDGPLFEKIKNYATSKLTGRNVKFSFPGGMSNTAIRETLRNNRFDCLVNSSQSEGVPVSIMEAMSYGIPCIAPRIGGISDLIYDQNLLVEPGRELSQNIAKVIEENYDNFKCLEYRDNNKKFIKEKFNADNNYERFISEVVT